MVTQISDADLLAMIVGRTLGATFPPKHTTGTDAAPLLRVEGLSGNGFENISLVAGEGEIVGIAGVVGNGQPAFLRALAGRGPSSGSVHVAGRELSRRGLLESTRVRGVPVDDEADDLQRAGTGSLDRSVYSSCRGPRFTATIGRRRRPDREGRSGSSPLSCRWIEAAARRPSAIASIRLRGP